jgi:hypothetical protein
VSEVTVAAPVPGSWKPGRWFFVGVLVWLGVGWGSTHPLGKIATETGHGPFGLIFCWGRLRWCGGKGSG